MIKMKSAKKFLAIILSLITILSFGATASAEENWKDLLGTVVDGSVLTDADKSTGYAREEAARGYYLADGTSYIEDKGNGLIYISGSTSCYRTAEEVRTDVYLQKLVNGTWVTVTYQYDSEYNTYYGHNGFYITVTPGYYYRTMTNHIAIKGDAFESMTSRTDGLYIG